MSRDTPHPSAGAGSGMGSWPLATRLPRPLPRPLLLAALALGACSTGESGGGTPPEDGLSTPAVAEAELPPGYGPSDPLAPVGTQPYVVVLGVGQDGGFPQAGTKEAAPWEDRQRRRLPVSLGIVDPVSGERWMVEATPAFPEQLQALDRIAPVEGIPGLSGIFLTHAHVGHYTGLIHLGREIIGARGVPVYTMPRMEQFLRENGPWNQLVALENIELRPLAAGLPTPLNERIQVTPILVPHRDEYSETVGFVIRGPERSVFFLPDIDKWEAWDALGTRIEDVIARVDAAYLDATFFGDGEIPGRAMSEIPHPFVEESLDRFGPLPLSERQKVRFIHLNRTNPVGWPGTPEWNRVVDTGMRIALRGERVGL
jgi:pyrroloquinoline quinone biosynthesis protein B